MPGMSAKERMRNYRARMKEDPDRYNQYLASERSRWENRKQSGQIKSVKDMNEREARQQRRLWREKWRNRSKKNKVIINTPPQSPTEEVPIVITKNVRTAGRRRLKRDRSKAYRKIQKLENELAKEKKKADKFRKRYDRAFKKSKGSTPRSKAKCMLWGSRKKTEVRKSLVFHNALIAEFKEKVKKGDYSLVRKIARGSIIKKYKLQASLAKSVGISRVKKEMIKNKSTKRIQHMIKEVQIFLERDENTKMAPGKKDTITRHKVKKQKRYLMHSLAYLHKQFLKESPHNVSYSLFCRIRPFWICRPKPKDRDTCKCIVHENVQLKADRLKQLKIIDESNIEVIIKQICCDITSKECMYRNCMHCKDKELVTLDFKARGKDKIYFWEWLQRKESYTKVVDEETKTFIYKITLKDKIESSIEELVDKFSKDLGNICKHIFNMKHQFITIRNLKNELKDTEALVHIDFSENFNCGYSSEVQSAHFGASHRQASLHTGVIYTSNSTEPFCTISNSTRHDPAAIWAHLDPIIAKISNDHKDTNILHFLSDGPTTQYRNRKNLYLFSSTLFERGFIRATWNYTEAGHGKGAPDGVGGCLKRRADELISQGTDIPDAKTLFETLQKNTKIDLFYISQENINAFDTCIPQTVPPVIGIMKVHQVMAYVAGIIKTRILSCFCDRVNGKCVCYEPKIHILKEKESSIDAQTGRDLDVSRETEILDASSTGTELSNVEYENLSLSDLYPVNKFCLFLYEGKLYPGQIISVDENDKEIEVKGLKEVGTNKFTWEKMTLWYQPSAIKSLIEEPVKLTKRLFKVDDYTWNIICKG